MNDEFYEVVKSYLLQTGTFFYNNLNRHDLNSIIIWLEDEGINVVKHSGFLELEEY